MTERAGTASSQKSTLKGWERTATEVAAWEILNRQSWRKFCNDLVRTWRGCWRCVYVWFLLCTLRGLAVITLERLTMPYSSVNLPSGDNYFFPLTTKVVIVQNQAPGAFNSRVTVPGFVSFRSFSQRLYFSCCAAGDGSGPHHLHPTSPTWALAERAGLHLGTEEK